MQGTSSSKLAGCSQYPSNRGPGGQRWGSGRSGEPRPAQCLAPSGCAANTVENCPQPWPARVLREHGGRTVKRPEHSPARASGHRTGSGRPPPSRGSCPGPRVGGAASGRGQGAPRCLYLLCSERGSLGPVVGAVGAGPGEVSISPPATQNELAAAELWGGCLPPRGFPPRPPASSPPFGHSQPPLPAPLGHDIPSLPNSSQRQPLPSTPWGALKAQTARLPLQQNLRVGPRHGL